MTDKATRAAAGEELVNLLKPGPERDVTYLSAAGEIRFVEGRAEGVPLSVARELAGPSWSIEPRPVLEGTDERRMA
jgi:hypothetical protein